jgi:hypothetical protein
LFVKLSFCSDDGWSLLQLVLVLLPVVVLLFREAEDVTGRGDTATVGGGTEVSGSSLREGNANIFDDAFEGTFEDDDDDDGHLRGDGPSSDPVSKESKESPNPKSNEGTGSCVLTVNHISIQIFVGIN